MFRLLSRRGRLALLLAGVLGIAPLRTTPAADSSRTREITVELAWMADPITFRCPLRVRATSAGLEVSGTVPDAATRARALQIARVAVSGTVVDALTCARVNSSTAPSRPEDTHRGVRRALTEILARAADTIYVGTRGDGQVTLRGEVPSLEDRHAISTRLRLVNGCSSVVNLLEVPSAATKPHVPTNVRRVSAEVLVPKATQPSPGMRHTPQPIAVSAPTEKKRFFWQRASKPTPPSPAPAPTAKRVVVPEPLPVAEPLTERSVTAITRTPQPQRSRILASPSPYGIMRVSAPVEDGNIIANTEPNRTPGLPIARSATGIPITSRTPLEASPASRPLLIPSPAAPPPRPVQSARTPTGSPVPAVASTRPSTVFAEEHRVDPVRSHVVPRPAGTKMPIAQTIRPGQETAPGAPAQTVQAQPVSSRMPRLLPSLFRRDEPAKKSNVPAIPNRPYVTTGTVTFHDAPAASPSTPVSTPTVAAAPSVVTADGLRQKVLSACSGSVKDVVVQSKPDNNVQVIIKVGQNAPIEQIMTKVIQVPELTSPRVSISFEVIP